MRPLRAIWRDTLLLVRQFLWPLLFFGAAVLVSGIIYHNLAQELGEPIGSSDLGEALYHVMGLTFFQPLGDELPNDFRLEIFYFVMPIIGLVVLALGLTDFGILFFNRSQRSKEWEMAVASTFNNHIILVGLGHLGFRVAQELHELDKDVVIIEKNPQDTLINQTQAMGFPVIVGDARREEELRSANVAQANAMIICTQDDSMNLQIAFNARKQNPTINMVVRIFDEEFGRTINEQFGFRAMSATGMSAPIFATAATGADVTRPLTIEGESLSLAKLIVPRRSQLVGMSMAKVEELYDVSVVFIRRAGISDFHPAGIRTLAAEDTIAIFGGHKQIGRLVNDNL
ncbi:MAG: potassium channel protein [Anaerolineae bacterium]|nr:potassium channel protein [Anaerolineae bacterium]